MKNAQGLLIAVVLGLAGAALNWFYLEQRSRALDKVSFIGIREGVAVRRGDVLREEVLVPVDIPNNAVGQLRDFAYLYKDRNTVIGQSPKRAYTGGELLLRQDFRTPPAELKFGGPDEKDQRTMWIPVDTSTFVPSLVVPGDKVSFLVQRSEALGVPTPADGSESPAPPATRGGSEIIGPFRVLSLGNRLGSAEVMQAAHIPQLQENVMTIGVQMQGDELEPKAKRLYDMLRRSNFRQVTVILHPRSEREE